MTFPVVVNLFGMPVRAHVLAELIAYTGGFQLYLQTRRFFPRARMPAETMMGIILAAMLGALVGSKLLAWVESPGHYLAIWRANPLEIFHGGKTVVGGLLGGWIGVEIAKRLLHVRHSTGDAFVFPLIFGQCIGRIGCFLTGLEDHTYGLHTALPWGVDFGDGPRHPTQLYEIAFLLVLAEVLWRVKRAGAPNGALFQLYLAGYLLFRLAVEFIKPIERLYLGLSAIQMASAIGAVVLLTLLVRDARSINEPVVMGGE